ncbi:hypothetical protein PQR75_43975 [Paraburkholderia fungorum]|uniref:hypothetical protein n=1 Tax=Paraburkholderia fungorum TaxID=134537 RepID=UPI0038BCAB9B
MANWRRRDASLRPRHGLHSRVTRWTWPRILGRLPKPDNGDSGERRLNLTLRGTQAFALERLVAHFSLSKPAVIERLIDWADDTPYEVTLRRRGRI